MRPPPNTQSLHHGYTQLEGKNQLVNGHKTLAMGPLLMNPHLLMTCFRLTGRWIHPWNNNNNNNNNNIRNQFVLSTGLGYHPRDDPFHTTTAHTEILLPYLYLVWCLLACIFLMYQRKAMVRGAVAGPGEWLCADVQLCENRTLRPG